MIAFGYEHGTQVIRWDNRYEYMYDNDGNPTTGRTFNFNYENGLLFRYDYTADNYYFRPWLPFSMEGTSWDGRSGQLTGTLVRINCLDGYMEYDDENKEWVEVRD